MNVKLITIIDCARSRPLTLYTRDMHEKTGTIIKDIYFSCLPLTLISKFARLRQRLLWIIGLCPHATMLDANGNKLF